MNYVLLEPKNRDNLATIIRSGQNFGVKTVFVIGGFVREKYKGNIGIVHIPTKVVYTF